MNGYCVIVWQRAGLERDSDYTIYDFKHRSEAIDFVTNEIVEAYETDKKSGQFDMDINKEQLEEHLEQGLGVSQNVSTLYCEKYYVIKNKNINHDRILNEPRLYFINGYQKGDKMLDDFRFIKHSKKKRAYDDD